MVSPQPFKWDLSTVDCRLSTVSRRIIKLIGALLALLQQSIRQSEQSVYIGECDIPCKSIDKQRNVTSRHRNQLFLFRLHL